MRVTRRSPVLKVEDETKHILDKIDEYLPPDTKLYAHGIEDGVFKEEPMTTVVIKVPHKRVPGQWVSLRVNINDIEFLADEDEKRTTH